MMREEGGGAGCPLCGGPCESPTHGMKGRCQSCGVVFGRASENERREWLIRRAHEAQDGRVVALEGAPGNRPGPRRADSGASRPRRRARYPLTAR